MQTVTLTLKARNGRRTTIDTDVSDETRNDPLKWGNWLSHMTASVEARTGHKVVNWTTDADLVRSALSAISKAKGEGR